MCEYCGSDYLYKINVCFLITNIDIEKIWEYKGSISNFFNSPLHESIILELAMILIIVMNMLSIAVVDAFDLRVGNDTVPIRL